eukprot:scaffold7357_cov195-Pinguiococcus_pyrenoidosus.AAC.13
MVVVTAEGVGVQPYHTRHKVEAVPLWSWDEFDDLGISAHCKIEEFWVRSNVPPEQGVCPRIRFDGEDRELAILGEVRPSNLVGARVGANRRGHEIAIPLQGVGCQRKCSSEEDLGTFPECHYF